MCWYVQGTKQATTGHILPGMPTPTPPLLHPWTRKRGTRWGRGAVGGGADRWVLQQGIVAGGERGVRLHHDALRPAILPQRGLHQQGMQLHLIHRRWGQALGPQGRV